MEESVPDWIYLPIGVAETSLWDALHDAELKALRSDLFERTVSLEFGISHLQDLRRLPEGYQWVFIFERVKSFRLARYEIWPGGFADSPDLSREERDRRIEEYRDKWREESVSWKTLADALTAEEDDFYVMEAGYVESEKSFSLRLEGYLENFSWYKLFLSAESLRILGSDGADWTLPMFKQMGEAYWTSFVNKRND